MKDLHHLPTSSTIEAMVDKSKTGSPSNRNVDITPIKTNPKIDTQLLSDYHRLVDASKGVPKHKRGANYRLSHPFGSNDVPTDAIPIGRRRDIIKRPKHR